MKKKINTYFFLFLILSGPTKILIAGGFQVTPQGEKASGTGGAFTGLCSDASTVFFNPGGMSSLTGKHHMIAGTSLIYPAVSVQTDAVYNTNMTSPMAHPVQLYYVFNINEHAAFGFGVNNQFGAVASYPDEWEGKYIVQKLSLTTFMYQPSFSYKFNKYASFGIGYVISYGEFEFKKAVPVSNNSISHGTADLTGNGQANSFNAGFFTQPLEDVSAGVSFRKRLKMNVPEGIAKFSGIPVSLSDVFPSETKFNTSFLMPAVLSSGVSFHLDSAKKVRIVFDAVRTYWSDYDSLLFNFNNAKTPDGHVAKLYRNTMTYRIGTGIMICDALELRGGLYYDESPVPDGYVSPELPDNTHTGFTLGAGWKFCKNYSVDAAWIHAGMRRNGSYDEEGFSGKYHTLINVFAFNLSLDF